MNKKWIIMILVTLGCALLLWSGAVEPSFRHNRNGDWQFFLKIEKISLLDRAFSQKSIEKMTTLAEGPLDRLNESGLAQKCRNEPLAFSIMALFCGVSICGLLFILHLIRSDARFS